MSYNHSMESVEYLSRDNPLFWNRPSPANCNIVRLIGLILWIVGCIGMVLNGLLVHSFVRYKSLRSPPNIFIMFIVTIGFLASCSILPAAGTSSIYCYWLFGRAGCQFSSVMAFLYGCSSSYLLCAVSLSRCYIIIRPFNAKDVTVTKCTVVASVAVTIAFIWTMLPIMGWNEYTLEEVRTSCCVNWKDRSMLYVSFTFFLFVFVYCIPLIILVITNTIIYIGLKRMKDKVAHGIKTELSQKRIEMERRVLKSILITVSGFIFTWTPYAVIFFMSAFRGKDSTISPMATFICACFAKSSVMWIPMLYIGTSTHYQFSFVNTHALEKQTGNVSTGPAGPIPSITVRKSDKTAEKDFSEVNQ